MKNLNPHTATRAVNEVIRRHGLGGVTGKVFSRWWGEYRGEGPMRTVVYMTDSASRERVITVLTEEFDDIEQVYRFDRDDTVATYCAIGILRTVEEG